MAAPLLEVEDLTVSFPVKNGEVTAVRGVSFEVHRGETLAIVGESGSGKSVSVMALMGLLPDDTRIGGRATFDGMELLALDKKRLREVRGRRISMIFQDPMTAFNPVFTIGDQIAEAMLVHDLATKAEARTRVIELLELVGVPSPKQRADQYPHEYSGGMRQRAMIAMAIANKPDLMIADEPTTALDVTIQAQVMEVLADIQREVGAALILITHDLGVVAGVADRVNVMYGGKVFEKAETRKLFYSSKNPYTRGLLESLPRLDAEEGARLVPIPGSPPSLMAMPAGCAFAPRCTHKVDICAERSAELIDIGLDHQTRCHLAHDLPAWEPDRAETPA
ncbi:MAG: ABC transporter ATP-binding protein [Actinomycetota bacterium]